MFCCLETKFTSFCFQFALLVFTNHLPETKFLCRECIGGCRSGCFFLIEIDIKITIKIEIEIKIKLDAQEYSYDLIKIKIKIKCIRM